MSVSRDLYWLKQMYDAFDEPVMRKLRKLGSDYVIIYQRMMLLSLKESGYITLQGLEPTAEEEIAFILDEDSTQVRFTMSFLRQVKLLEEKPGQIYMVRVPDLVGKETKWAKLKRQQRLEMRQGKLEELDNVQCVSKSSPIELELDIELDIDKDSLYSLSHKSNFKEFRKFLSDSKYSFSFQDGICGYMSSTKFKVTSTGYIHNLNTAKDVSSEDAQKIWDYLYQNRQKIIEHLSHNKEEIQQ